MESGFVCSPILMKGDIKLFKKTENKILVKEIERLKKENGTLMYKLELANESKNEYDMLIQELKEQRDKYKPTHERRILILFNSFVIVFNNVKST